MQRTPLLHVCQGALREVAVHLAGCDVDRDPVLALQRVEVQGCMVTVVNGDHDSEEAAFLRHGAV